MNKLGIGFIGTGFVNTLHAKSLITVRNAEVTGVCSRHEKSGKQFAAFCDNLGIGVPKPFTELAEMIRNPAVDAVWIGSPNFLRVEQVKTITEEITQGKAELKGICCEKPLARTVKEAADMVHLIEKVGIPHGYLENTVFMPTIDRGREILWRRGALTSGRPYLARSAEEHSGPHSSWFWIGKNSGGGVLTDMMCHSLEGARYLLTGLDEPKDFIKPKTVSAEIATLKWSQPKYAKKLQKRFGKQVDYLKDPSEDYAKAIVTYETKNGDILMAESTNSWCFMGPGMRLIFELIGPEYFMEINGLKPMLHVFFSREVSGKGGDDLVEKQSAEQGLMPVLEDEPYIYGYQAENRHMVDSFLKEQMPRENWNDGLFITRMMAALYMSAENKKKLNFPPQGLDGFVPKVGLGTFKPQTVLKGQ
ncbi:Gfo/Idh/MocA family protein [[Eubacterium] cellulosolvens]